MKKLLVFSLLLTLPMIALSQNTTKPTSLTKMQNINFDEADAIFKTKAINAAMEAECCYDETCKCTDLLDPWEKDKSLTFDAQISKMLSAKNASKAQVSMAQFEKAILEGKGKKRLNTNTLKVAFAKHPGFSLGAISKRMDIYIQQLESENEDE